LKVLLQMLTAPFRALARALFRSSGGGYLCDNCKWDYGDACKRPERPNAKVCPDHKRR
jgi:hypothetical protein